MIMFLFVLVAPSMGEGPNNGFYELASCAMEWMNIISF